MKTAWTLPRVALVAGALALADAGSAQEGRSSASSWSTYFEGAVTVSRKAGYVHVFWDAHGAAGRLGEGAARRASVLEAVAELVREKVTGGDDEKVKIDVVVVTERDSYGKPVYMSLKRVAHLEGRAGPIRKAAATSKKGTELEAAFESTSFQ